VHLVDVKLQDGRHAFRQKVKNRQWNVQNGRRSHLPEHREQHLHLLILQGAELRLGKARAGAVVEEDQRADDVVADRLGYFLGYALAAFEVKVRLVLT
jgi:hypothetical protein